MIDDDHDSTRGCFVFVFVFHGVVASDGDGDGESRRSTESHGSVEGGFILGVIAYSPIDPFGVAGQHDGGACLAVCAKRRCRRI